MSLALFSAQDSGNIFGSVTDTSGDALPGSTVTLTGFGTTQFRVTDSQGSFRFLGLDPGTWEVKAELDHYSTVQQPNVVVSINRNTEIVLTLSTAIAESITVTAESPLLDERKISSGTTISQLELEKIPSVRDPWGVMTQAAGVLLDRVNVGGSESPDQPLVIGAGTGQRQNAYSLDGADITDRFGDGTSKFFDFDQIAEYQLETGGSDVSREVPGVTFNLVTKRGSSEFRGSARFYLTDPDGYFGALRQGSDELDPEDLGPGQPEDAFGATRVGRIQEYGFEAGGPLWRDHLWAWAAWSTNDVTRISANGTDERFVLPNEAIKLNAQLSPANSAVASFNNGDREWLGALGGPNIGADALWDFRGPTGITTIEDSHVFGSNLFLSGRYTHIDFGFSAASTGGCGPTGQEFTVGADGIQHGRGCGNESRPSDELKADASWFTNTGTLSHEIKFGGRIRRVESTTDWTYPGRDILNYHGAYFGVQDPDLLAIFGLPPERYMDAHFLYAYRQGGVSATVDYRGLWGQDTITWGKWTVNDGLRYDVADGENKAGVVDANPAFPQVMPEIDFGGNDADGVRWSVLQPRVGVTYALGEERNTLLRGSLGRFADPLSAQVLTRRSPLDGQFASILFIDEPDGRTGIYDDGELFAVVGGLFGFDPDNPTALENSNLNDPGLDAPLTDELILGVEHAFLPEFVVGLQYTHRQGRDILDERDLFTDPDGNIRTAGRADYIAGEPIDFSLPGDSRVFEYTPLFAGGLSSIGGTLLANGVRDTTYDSIALTATKRLSNRWMLRGYLQWGEVSWDIPDSQFDNNDPNILRPASGGSLASNASVDGALKIEQGFVMSVQASWSWNVNGMVQIAPERAWGFNLAANVYGRQGYPIPYFVRIRSGRSGDGVQRDISANEVALGAIDAFRSDDLLVIDFRIEKEFAATGNTSLTFSIDGFNLLNEPSVTNRSSQNLGSPTAGWLSETLGPRIWRLGVRLSWR
ncbi:MAG: carboxypeptidase regulatory-like domain-containing protein [Acidobacteriota bacterium]